MKKHLLLTGCAFILGITGVAVTQAGSHFFATYSAITGSPSTCAPDVQPPGCTLTTPGVICTVGSFTFYRNSSCTSPWYKPS